MSSGRRRAVIADAVRTTMSRILPQNTNENYDDNSFYDSKLPMTQKMATTPYGSRSASNYKKRRRPPNAAVLFWWVPFFSALLRFPDSATTLTTAFQSSALATIPTTRGQQGHHPHRRQFRFHGRFNLNSHGNILSIPEADCLTDGCKERIANQLRDSGIWDDDDIDRSSEHLILLARDFLDRPEVFSSLLISDFGFPALVAHQTRTLAMAVIRGEQESRRFVNNSNNSSSSSSIDGGSGVTGIATRIETEGTGDVVGISNQAKGVANNNVTEKKNGAVGKNPVTPPSPSATDSIAVQDPQTEADTTPAVPVKKYSDKELKSTVVNERAKRRKRSVLDYNYGLPNDYAVMHPKLASELDDYYTFMTQPSTFSQENPIRDATAKVYLNHAKLFLGWCRQNAQSREDDDDDDDDDESAKDQDSELANEELSLFAVIPNKEKESADNIIRFVLWMRSRDISVSYEANILRGIIKLLKFRFAKESKSDPLEGQNTFDDIPIIKEVRKLHRDANQRQRLAPRSSDESKKWITWKDYIGVTKNVKNDVLQLIERYEKLPASKRKYGKGDVERIHSLEQIRVADAYQRYLILAILASVPDRQRTIRELEVGRTLMKDAETNCWAVKHGPNDYKTGKHYGERPAMQLAEELTPAIDDFLENWRPALKPSTDVLFVQSRTGKPMTSNSIFKRVVRCCFKYTGKSVNPHLLRDIIVTHVRETDASEKELEALALYMGHSIQMQRTSYDRRTLSTKVAPAIKLMRSVNNVAG